MKYIVLIVLLLIIALLIESEREKKSFEIERVSFKTDKINKNKKLIFISDLHDKEFGKDNIELIEAIKNEKPDYILIGGDVVVTKRNRCSFMVLDNLLKELTKITKVIYANGNHEQRFFYDKDINPYKKYKEEFVSILDKYNVEYLSDSHVELGDIDIYGLNLDEKCYNDLIYKKLETEYVHNKFPNINKDRFNILLAHNPLFLDVYETLKIDLGLAGHFHGGVLRLGKQGVLTSQWHLFSKWCCGIFKINNSNFIVSRGLGGHTINVRVNNPPELTVIELKHTD